ncbi:phage tail length tape measure family protein [Paracidovorax citrulli]|uniref:phage tail length tape measure family protein n=1 Tax=Paracidovorax citrulli TaxID=80869 RepID=UPI000944822D|nr:phage tail length tape measure family protein [Paracidovorax citrulli]UMT88380.1 tail length tape measure protein [Paracidovorax citrulli]WIY32711.1 phage tail length tape measure family protein [Paracidovorax citrulli]
MSDMKIQGEFEMDVTKGEQALARVETGARRMASTVKQAGDAAADSIESLGGKADQSAKAIERANASLASAARRAVADQQRAVVEAQGYSLKSAEGLEQLARMRGADVSAISGQLGALRQLRAEQDRLTQAVQQQREVESRARQQSEFVASLQSQVTAIGRTRSELLAMQAAQLGVSDKAAPMIARLREQEQGLGKVGVSAAQTAAALRGLPAQISDIVVSLQGGQAPLTVFLQQGSQIKDQFGGAGAAIKGLGGYLMGLLNPLTAAAAAAGVLALAYYQGTKEAEGYRNAITLTGNAAGTTAGELKAYAQEISGVAGTQGKAAESLTALAGTGKVVGDVLRDAGLAAVQYERATGQAVSKTAEQFADLRKEPLAGVLKLNDGMNFLTESTYRQIKSLEDQGRTTDAARVAQQAYADALISRAGDIDRNLGTLERGWRAVADAAKKGWDNMLGLGRAQTTQDKLKQVKEEIAAVEKQLDSGRGFGSTEGGAAFGNGRGAINAAAQQQLKDRLASLGAEAAALEGVAYAEKAAAEEGRERADQMQATQAWEKAGEKYLSDKAKMERELTQARNEGAAAGRSKAEIEERLANIREEYAKKGGAAVKSEQTAYQSLAASIQAKIDKNRQEIETGGKLNSAEAQRAELLAQIAQNEGRLTATNKAKILAKLDELDVSERLLAVERDRRKFEEQRDKENVRIADDISKINARAQALEDEASAYGKSSTELRALTVDRLNEQKAILQGFPGSQQRIDQINDEIAAIRRLGAAEDQIAGLKIQSHADDLLRSAQEQARIYADEAKLAGLSRLEREKIIALRQVELKFAKELAAVDKMPDADDAQREAKRRARDTIEQAKRIEGEAAVSKVIQDDWSRTTDEINRSLTDALLRGFESGKGFAENLRDTLKNMFNTLVLRPIISAIIAPVAGVISGATNALLGGGNGVGGAAQAGLSAYNFVSSGFNVASSVGSRIVNSDLLARYGSEAMQEMLGQFGAGMMNTSSWAAFRGAFEAGGANFAGAIAGSVLNGFSGYGISKLVSGGYQVNKYVNTIGAIASMIPGVGPIAGLISGAVNRLFGRKLKDTGIEGTFGGEAGFEGRSYQYYKGGLFRSSKTKYGELDEEVRKGLADQFGAMKTSIKEMGKVLGLGGEALDKFTARIKVSLQGLSPEDAQKKLQEEFEKLGISMADLILGLPTTIQEAASDRKNLSWPNSDAAAAAPVDPVAQANLEAFKKVQKAGESSLDTITRLATSLAATNGVFETLGHSMYAASLQGGDMADKLVELFGGVDKFAAANADYFQRFYAPEEQRAAARKQLEKQLATVDIKLPDINADDARAQYRKLVEAQDLNTEAGRKAYAVLIQLAGAFDQVAISADTRRGLEERLLAAQGNDRAVIEMRRKQERDALMQLDPALARLVQQIYDLEDATAVADKRVDLYQRLLTAQGKDREALALRRSQELAALAKLNPALVQMAEEIYRAEDAAAAQVKAQQGREAAYTRLQNAATLESERLNALLEGIDAQRTALGQQRALADESLSLITGVFDLVRSNARELYGQVESTASMQAAAGWAFVERALETARRTGYLPDQAPLQEAIGAARGGLDSRAYATQFEQDRDRLVLAGMLSGLESISGRQKTAAEQQIKLLEDQGKALDLQTETINRQLKAQQEMLDYWRRQIDIANGTFDATLSVEQAIDKLATALGKPPATKPPQGGGSQAVWGGSSPGTVTAPAQPEAKYRRVTSLGTSIGYTPVIDQALIAKLDGLSGLYHSFDGTGDLIGLLTAIRSAGGTLDDLSILSGYFYSDWVKAAASVGVPAFAVGTNYVPYDTPAIVHKGERIIPAADNRALMAAIDAGQQSGRSERLEGLVAQLVAENRQQAGEILRLNARIAKVLERWDGDGTPPQREEQTA